MPSTEFDLPTDTDADDNQSESDGIKSLRQALRKAQKEAAEVAAERDALRTRVRTLDVQDAFTSAGVNPKLAKFYDGELTKDAVAAWAADNADVFGITPPGDQPGGDSAPELTENQQIAARAAAAAAQGNSPEVRGLQEQLEALLNDPEGYEKAKATGLIQERY